MSAWLDYRDAGFKPARHHLLLIEHLERVSRGEILNLMVCMPPGSAKSTYSSVEFVPWFMGVNAGLSVIAASHTQELAERFGRRARNIAMGDTFSAAFGQSVAGDSAAAGRWETTLKGEYFAAGVGGSITGRRADLGLIDDPVKSREDADSERSREKAWDWYVNDFLTRLKPGARQVIVMTRWHEDDLGGRILARERDKWTVLELPMEAMRDDPLGREPGQLLWPEWFTGEMVTRAKQDARSWNALYQQQPASEDGDYFKFDWFQEYEQKPDNLRVFMASDFAVTDGKGDYTEHGVIGIDNNDNMYLLDWWYGQTTSDVWIDQLCTMFLEHAPICWFGEAGPIRRAIEPYLMRRIQERQAYSRIEWLASISDKETRARGFQARAASGKVFVPKNALWKSHVVGQLAKFPAGKHDDAVDVCSLVGRGLQYMGKPKSTAVAQWTPIQHKW
jgi:predicted phage terminase large subunit-like protein